MKFNAIFLFLGVVQLLFLSLQSSAQSFPSWVDDDALQHCLEMSAKSNGWSNAEEFTEIKCNSKGVRSLNGLEKFIKVTSLSIYNNKLKNIDVDLSYFHELSMLNLARNDLRQASFQGLPKLETLYVFGNKISNLSIVDLPELKLIKAHNNKATQFKYSNTPKLHKIYAFNNQLETFDIDNLPMLEYMDCRQNPMPDALYDKMDKVDSTTFLHDGNADDW